MNKQFDMFVKMKIKELCENISRMTYAYVNPETKLPTVVPASHYRNILDQPVEVMVNDQIKRQFLNIMYKQMKALKEEEPSLFMETLLLMDLNKTPDSLSLNEEAALKLTVDKLSELEKEKKKGFHLLDQNYLDSFNETKSNQELMAEIVGMKEPKEERIYEVDFSENGKAKVKKKDKGFER